MVLQEKVMTVAEFWETYAGKPYELVRGRIIEIMPTGYSHGAVTRRAAAILGQHVDENDLGDVVGAETGFYLSETTMRGADAAFISKGNLAKITEPEKYLPFAPDLAAEVVSPSDTAADIQDKVDLYLDGGTQLVWVMYPDSRKVVAHYPDRTAKTFFDGDILDGGAVLPGLQFPVGDLFPPVREPEENNE